MSGGGINNVAYAQLPECQEPPAGLAPDQVPQLPGHVLPPNQPVATFIAQPTQQAPPTAYVAVDAQYQPIPAPPGQPVAYSQAYAISPTPSGYGTVPQYGYAP